MQYRKESYKRVGIDIKLGYVYFCLNDISLYDTFVTDITEFLPLDDGFATTMCMVYPQLSNHVDWLRYAIEYWEGSVLSDYSDYCYIVAREYNGEVVIG